MTTDGPASRILVVEDEESLADTVRYNLEREGYAVAVAADGRTALDRFRSENPSLVILDLMLPEMSGLDVCRQIRQISNVPIIMVTAKDSEADKVSGLELGADDYVTKPFSPRELAARIRAILRRAEQRSEDEMLAVGEIVLRRDSHEVTVRGEYVELTSKEFDLLACFLEHRGIVLSRERLLDLVWGVSYPGGTRTVDMHVAQLRRKLQAPETIRTIRGAGYKLQAT